MKVLIVDTVSYDRAPYLQYYIKACKEKNVPFDLFLWNRDMNGGLQKDKNIFTMNCVCPFGGSKLKKIFPMLKYRKALLQTIKNNHYTHLVLVNTLAPEMISSYVLSHYKGKYILDIRDYTYERISIYKKIENTLIRNSNFTTISSRGFLKFIDSNPKIIVNHNISNIKYAVKEPTLRSRKPVRIGFVGSVRYPEENIKLIEALRGKDFLLKYVGPEVAGCDLKGYCTKNNIINVIFQGKFKNHEKAAIYKEIDIINSIYGDFSLEVTTAIPNRYYDALLFKKPIIASKGTYLGELVRENGIGLVVDLNQDSVEDKLVDYIHQFDTSKFLINCHRALNDIMTEQNNFYQYIKEFLQN